MKKIRLGKSLVLAPILLMTTAITAANAALVIRAGADGVSVISAVSMAEEPVDAARRLGAAAELALTVKASGQAGNPGAKRGEADGR